MNTAPGIAFGIVAAGILLAAGGLAWRIASRRASLPCPVWLGWMVEMENPFFKVHHTREIIGHLQLQPGMQVLDLGCGPGRLAVPAAREVGPEGRVTAMDIQSGMLQRAQERARAAGADNIRFLEAGAGEGKIERGRYDRALLVTVLGEIPDREAALRELFGALKPGGILSITEVIADPHFQGAGAVRRQAESAGFAEKDFFGNRFAYTLNLEKPGIV
jgi:2-polyprenyl-3-methyl-5-hydroxy-6-metoxy-1,4-benzoquinol methylase